MRPLLLLLVLGCSIIAAPVPDQNKTLSFSDLLTGNSTTFFEEMERTEAQVREQEECLQRQACWIAVAVVFIAAAIFTSIYYCCKYYSDCYVYVYFNSAIFRRCLLKKRVWKETRRQKKIIKQKARANRYIESQEANAGADEV